MKKMLSGQDFYHINALEIKFDLVLNLVKVNL